MKSKSTVSVCWRPLICSTLSCFPAAPSFTTGCNSVYLIWQDFFFNTLSCFHYHAANSLGAGRHTWEASRVKVSRWHTNHLVRRLPCNRHQGPAVWRVRALLALRPEQGWRPKADNDSADRGHVGREKGDVGKWREKVATFRLLFSNEQMTAYWPSDLIAAFMWGGQSKIWPRVTCTVSHHWPPVDIVQHYGSSVQELLINLVLITYSGNICSLMSSKVCTQIELDVLKEGNAIPWW